MLDNTPVEAIHLATDTQSDNPGIVFQHPSNTLPPGYHFGHLPAEPRKLDPGMGIAVARRTVFRPTDEECFGRVADRVAAGNMSLLKRPLTEEEQREEVRLRNAIATGALLTSGRHLQHGDHTQSKRNIEVYSNCSTAIMSSIKFYLLLNGSGVGRSYDDQLMVVDWQKAPTLKLYISPAHADYPHTFAEQCQLGIDLGILPWGATAETPVGDSTAAEVMAKWVATEFVDDLDEAMIGARYHRVEDSREGWAKALEIYESMAYQGLSHETLLLEFSYVRKKGSPIGGMQDRPASGPISVMSAFYNIRTHIVKAARRMPLWEQSLRADHHTSVEVQVGGARRAARMATKDWRDRDVLLFIRIKSEGGLWTANHSIMVDKEFWELVNSPKTDDPLSIHAHAVFDEAIRCSWINGEPGFINGDMLEDYRTGFARKKPVYADGSDFQSSRYKITDAALMMKDLAERAAVSRFPITVNPCGEIVIHVTGGLCIITDYAPLLSCPVPLEDVTPGQIPDDIAALWDARVEDSVRLGVRFLIRVNTMESLYQKEVSRTNRIGIGPTGIHEYAWLRFGYDFNDLLDETVSAPFWQLIEQFSEASKAEATLYSRQLGLADPVTVTTAKPAGSTSKLFGLTEGVHLPAMRYYLRNVQFKGTRTSETESWDINADPLLAQYERSGYPIRSLKTFQGMSIVGFPTVPLLMRLGIGNRSVTASEATPEQQYQWLRLLEKYWIGAERGNQLSYTLKVFTNQVSETEFRDIVSKNQPTVRCCSVLPSKPNSELGYEYLPEEEVTLDAFASIVEGITADAVKEEIDLVHLQCASGVCPI